MVKSIMLPQRMISSINIPQRTPLTFLSAFCFSFSLLLIVLLYPSPTLASTSCNPVSHDEVSIRFEIVNTSDVSISQFWQCVVIRLKGKHNVSVTVALPSGVFRLSSPLVIPSDWAPRGISVAIHGDNTRLHGTVAINDITPLRSEGSARGLVRVGIPQETPTSLPESEDRDHSTPLAYGPINLVLNGLIRWPSEWPSEEYLVVKDFDEVRRTITANLPERLTLTEGLRVQGFFRHDWSDSSRQIDLARSNIVGRDALLAIDGDWPKYGVQKGGRFKLINSIHPLEHAKSAAYIPKDRAFIVHEPSSDATFEVTSLNHLLVGSNVQSVDIRGISFIGSRLSAVQLSGSNIHISNCTFSDNSLMGLSLQGHHITVKDSVFLRHGSTPVLLRGGNRHLLAASEIEFNGNRIEDFGNIVWSSVPAIRSEGFGIRIAYNNISKGPHSGIFFFGNNHRIENNFLTSLALRTGDVGVIYTGRDWSGRGNIVSGNVIANARGHGSLGATAIYVDDQASGVRIEGNLIVNSFRGVLIGGGRDNVVVNNYFSAVAICLRADARGETWQVPATLPNGELWRRLHQVPFSDKAWREAYPALQDILTYRTGSPVRNSVHGNISNGCAWQIDEPVRNFGSISGIDEEWRFTAQVLPSIPDSSRRGSDARLFSIDRLERVAP
jgi:parallel beta-helix repeat protein